MAEAVVGEPDWEETAAVMVEAGIEEVAPEPHQEETEEKTAASAVVVGEPDREGTVAAMEEAGMEVAAPEPD